MIKKLKNTLNVVLAVIFLSASVQAGDVMSDMMSNMDNVTDLQSYTEADGTVNYYTGSASIRFDTVKNPGPLFAFTPPSIEAGCSGIDIKGMFMSIIGGDELADLFADAGASVAWGIALGIIYSLPGVANAFKFINGWAKKLQQLLAQACQAGIEIGQWAAKEANIDNLGFGQKIDSFLAEYDSSEYLKAKKKGHNALLEAMGWYKGNDSTTPELSGDQKLEAVADLMRGAFESDASMFGGIFLDIAKKAKGTTGSDSTLEHMLHIPKSNPSGEAIMETELFLDQPTMENMANVLETGGLTAVSQAKLSLFAYVLVYNFVGDLGIDVPSKDEMNKLYKGAVSHSEKDAAREQFETLKTKKPSKIAQVFGKSGLSSTKAKGKGLAKFIWYGTTDDGAAGATTVDQRAKNIKLIAPLLKIYTIRDKGTSEKSAYIPVLPYKANVGNSKEYYTSATYKGTIMTSKCVVDALVDGNGTVSSCDGSIEFPQIHKYVKIIKDSPVSDQYELKYQLTQVMAIKMAVAILGAIDESLSHLRASNGGAISSAGTPGETTPASITAKDNSELILEYRKTMSDVMSEARRQLEDVLGEESAKEGRIESIFEKQNMKNQERGLKSLQK